MYRSHPFLFQHPKKAMILLLNTIRIIQTVLPVSKSILSHAYAAHDTFDYGNFSS